MGKRPYRLTDQGLHRLRSIAAANRPWERSTGPRTPAGKNRSSRNAWKHGWRSREAIETLQRARAAIRVLGAVDASMPHEALVETVTEQQDRIEALFRLAERLELLRG